MSKKYTRSLYNYGLTGCQSLSEVSEGGEDGYYDKADVQWFVDYDPETDTCFTYQSGYTMSFKV